MGMNTPEVERGLIAELLEALRALPDVTADLARQVDAGGPAAVSDVSVSMQVAGRPLALGGGIRKVLYPRDALHELLHVHQRRSIRAGATRSSVLRWLWSELIHIGLAMPRKARHHPGANRRQPSVGSRWRVSSALRRRERVEVHPRQQRDS
jgi:hypothetical protein